MFAIFGCGVVDRFIWCVKFLFVSLRFFFFVFLVCYLRMPGRAVLLLRVFFVVGYVPWGRCYFILDCTCGVFSISIFVSVLLQLGCDQLSGFIMILVLPFCWIFFLYWVIVLRWNLIFFLWGLIFRMCFFNWVCFLSSVCAVVSLVFNVVGSGRAVFGPVVPDFVVFCPLAWSVPLV